MNPIHFQHVWKQYRIGSKHDSLRDAIPALLKRWSGRNGYGPQEGEFWALQDVSFDVKKGETLGIVGPNGAWKSTILKLLSRITEQTKGTVRVQGRLAALIELGGGFHQDLTGAENIYLQGTMLGFRRTEIRRLFDAIVAFSELEQFLQTPVKKYSSGMVVRLGFAIAAQIHPEVLLLDEVLAVGDLSFQQKCFQRIAELKHQGTTMIFISHNLEAVQKLCDRVLLLRNGQVISEGEPSAMVRRYREEVLAHHLTTAVAQRSQPDDSPLQIRQVVLKDLNGFPLQSLETGQPLRIETYFKADQPIRHPLFRVAIERLDGLLCQATLSRHSGLNLETLLGEGTLTLEYQAVNLLPNLYQVRVEIFEGNNPIPLAAVRQGCFFQITSDYQEQGTVHLDHAWNFGGK